MGSRGIFLVLNEKSCFEEIKSIIGIFHQALNPKNRKVRLLPIVRWRNGETGSRGTFLVLNEKSCSEVIKSVIGIFHQALNSSKKNCPLATHFYAIKANLMLIG